MLSQKKFEILFSSPSTFKTGDVIFNGIVWLKVTKAYKKNWWNEFLRWCGFKINYNIITVCQYIN